VKLLLQKGADTETVDNFNKKVDYYADTTTIKYWLQRAREANIPKMKELFKRVEMPRLSEIYMSLVGQEIATNAIIQHVYGKRADPRFNRKPIVLFLVGAPGHGKTQIAEDLMNFFQKKIQQESTVLILLIQSGNCLAQNLDMLEQLKEQESVTSCNLIMEELV